MTPVSFQAFFDELEKLGSAADYLSRLALRKGIDPARLPAIKQVGTLASREGGRGRAAEIAQSVRAHLKSTPSIADAAPKSGVRPSFKPTRPSISAAA